MNGNSTRLEMEMESFMCQKKLGVVLGKDRGGNGEAETKTEGENDMK